MEHQVCFGVIRGFIPVDQYKPVSPVVVDQASGRIDRQTGACNDQKIRITDGINALFQNVAV